MNPISAIDRKLLAVAGGPAPESIDDVIQRMESIDKLSMQDKVTGALGWSLLRTI